MRIYPTITLEEFILADKAANRARDPEASKIRTVFALFYLLVYVPWFTWRMIEESRRFSHFPSPYLFLAAVLFLLACVWWVFRRKREEASNRRAAYEAQLPGINNQFMDIETSGITGGQVNGSNPYNYPWSCFVLKVEIKDAFLFLLPQGRHVRVQKSLLTSDDQQTIRQWSAEVPSKNTR